MLSCLPSGSYLALFISLLLGLLFRYVPDAEISWHDTLIGAVITAILFTLGKYLIGLYLGQASVGAAYGAAGSAVAFMVWVYYASLILLLGAEITKTIARFRKDSFSRRSSPAGGLR